MKRVLVVSTVVAMLLTATAMGDRCVGPKDSSMYGVTVPPATPVIFCDDFDSYCWTNSTNNIKWPGYPPNPDTSLCTSGSDGSEWYMKQSYHWQRLSGAGGPPMTPTDTTTSRWEGWDGNPGWITGPYTAQDSGGDTTPGGARYGAAYMYWNLNKSVVDSTGTYASPIAVAFPDGSNAVNGTDQHPLVLRFWTHDGIGLGQTSQAAWNKPVNWPFYGELCMDGGTNSNVDRAPTDYIIANYSPTFDQCIAENVIKFPVICQQHPTQHIGLIPPTCPPASTTIHKSLAFGWLAPLDTDPCDVDGGRRPTMNHAATFDGLYWRTLVSNQNPGNGGDFNYGMSMGMFEMTVKSATYDLKLIAPRNCYSSGGCTNPPGYEIITSTATIARQYTGPFNRVAFGIAQGCLLDQTGADGETCLNGAARAADAWGYGFSNNVYVDRPMLAGGVGNLSTGACCVQTGENAGTCTDGLTEAQCTGVFHGANTTCATSAACCPLPFADADHDGDVDQDDFGAFQVCYTGAAGGVPTGCACFDRNNDGNVDGTDLTSFTNCWTGPNAPWTAALTPLCVP